jgi:DNA-binding transcriptional LysR family regulator
MGRYQAREGKTGMFGSSKGNPVPGFPNVRITLKDWRMLHAVASCGTFANAAQLLHVTQPAISYAISKLEEQLGLPLLELNGRKYKLTEIGTALLEHSGTLLQHAAALEEYAKHLQRGSSVEVLLAVDQEFPTSIVMPALYTFSSQCKDATVRLLEVHTSEIQKVLFEKGIDLAINREIPAGFNGDPLLEVEYVCVAHPDHPLFQLGRQLTQADLDREVQVLIKWEIVSFSSDAKEAGQVKRYWQVNNLETVESALCHGIGYGWLPRYRVRKLLEGGELKVLPLLNSSAYKSNFYLVHGRPAIRSPEAEQLANVLRSVAAIATGSLN